MYKCTGSWYTVSRRQPTHLTRVNTVQKNWESIECYIYYEFPVILIVKSSSRPLSGKMVVSNRDNGPLTWQLEPLSWMRSPPWLLFFHMSSSWLSGMLTKRNVWCVGLLPSKISSLLCPVKDDLGLRTLGVYSIPCECGQVYHWHIRLGYPDRLAVAEHRVNHNHLIKFQDTRILCIVPGCMEWLLREVVELELYPNNMNREDGLTLGRSCKPLLCLLRKSRWPTQLRWLAIDPFRGPSFPMLQWLYLFPNSVQW